MSSSAANAPGAVAPGSDRPWSVPGYTEVRALGGGGFGEVVLAVHDASGTQVAIKYLHQDLLRDQDQAAAFRAEARTLIGVDSPHVVRLFEYVEDPGGAAIVMELVDGVTLAKILDRQGKTTPEAALVVLLGSLLGLAAAHSRGVVHRDYKPANVLVDGHGASKLSDFGIAALAGDRPPAAGTLRYMPPEQFEGAPASPAADVYAATVTFYQCLAGTVPFDGRTATELYEQHKSAPVPLDDIPEPLRPVIARGMAKDPASRPSDAGGLAAELRDAATEGYGPDWEDHGLSHLAEAALLLALLWPSAGSSAVAGSAVEQVHLDDPSRAGQPAQVTRAGQVGRTTRSSGQPGQTQAEHAEHLEHVGHEEHLQHEQLQHEQHQQHEEHVEHEEHLKHLAHLSHLRRLRDDGEDADESGTSADRLASLAAAAADGATQVAGRVPDFARGVQGKFRGRRARVMAGGAAGAAVLLIVINVLLSVTNSSAPSPAGAAAPGTATAAAGNAPVSQPSGPSLAFTCPGTMSMYYDEEEVNVQPIEVGLATEIRDTLLTCSGEPPTVTCTAVDVQLHPESGLGFGDKGWYLNGTYSCTATDSQTSTPYETQWQVTVDPQGNATAVGS